MAALSYKPQLSICVSDAEIDARRRAALIRTQTALQNDDHFLQRRSNVFQSPQVPPNMEYLVHSMEAVRIEPDSKECALYMEEQVVPDHSDYRQKQRESCTIL
jgi:hypothetical protein